MRSSFKLTSSSAFLWKKLCVCFYRYNIICKQWSSILWWCTKNIIIITILFMYNICTMYSTFNVPYLRPFDCWLLCMYVHMHIAVLEKSAHYLFCLASSLISRFLLLFFMKWIFRIGNDARSECNFLWGHTPEFPRLFNSYLKKRMCVFV